MNQFIRKSLPVCLLTTLFMSAILAGCAQNPLPPPVTHVVTATLPAPTAALTLTPSPTPFAHEPLFDPALDILAGPVPVPLELSIPAIHVQAPVLGVGLTNGNVMDAPKGPYGDPLWHAAFWYRGSSAPGEASTATIAGHVNDPYGKDEIFAHLKNLQPGDEILLRYTTTGIQVRFVVDEVQVYSLEESAQPDVLERIYGSGPLAGLPPQPATDGRAHLTLITCNGYYVNGQYDHHTVVYATRVE